MGHECVGAAVEMEVTVFARGAFLCASAVRRFSVARAPVVTLPRQLTLMTRSLRDSLMQSLKRFFCPPTERFPLIEFYIQKLL